MNENIDIINSSTVDNFGAGNGGRVNVKTLRDAVNSSDFKSALDIVQLEDKEKYIADFNAQVDRIQTTTDRTKGPGQKLKDYPNELVKLKETLAGLRIVLNAMSNKVAALPQRVPPLPPSPPQTPLPPTPEPPQLALAEQQPEEQAPPVEAPSSQLEAPVDQAAQPVGEQQPEEQAAPVEAAPLPPSQKESQAAFDREVQLSKESLARLKNEARRPMPPFILSSRARPIISPQQPQVALPNYVAPETPSLQQTLSNPAANLESPTSRALPPRKELTNSRPQSVLPILEVGQSAKPSGPLRRGERASKPVTALAEPAVNPLSTTQSSPVEPIISPQQPQVTLPNYVAPELATPQQPPSNAVAEPSLTSLFRGVAPRQAKTASPQSVLPTLEVGQSAKPSIPLSEVNPLRRGVPSRPQATPQNISLRQPDISPQTICERDFPEVYRVLKLGKPYLSLLFSNTGIDDPRVQQLLKLIQYEKRADGVYLMGTSIDKVLAACHPDRGATKDPDMTEIFQMLDAIKNYTGVKQPVLSLPSILRIASQAAPAVAGPGSKSQKPGKKSPASEPPTGDLSKLFKRGDSLQPKNAYIDENTGQSVTLTVTGDYDPTTRSIEVEYNGERNPISVVQLAVDFKVVRQPDQKRLFKKGERVLVKLPKNIAKIPQALRTEIEKGSCTAPFYATVQADQDARSENVMVKCDKGPEKPFTVKYDQLSYQVKALEVPEQPTPVAPVAVEGSAPLRRGLAEVKTSNPARTPENISECDRKLIGMTERAKTCETQLATLRQELAEMTAANKAENDRLEANIAQEKARLSHLQTSKTELEQQLRTASKAEQDLRDYLGKQGRELSEFRTKTDMLEREKAKLQVQTEVLKGDLERNAESAERLNAEREEKFNTLNALLGSTTRQLQETLGQQAELQDAYRQKQADLDQAQASVADLNSRFATTDALITAADQHITAQLSTISRSLEEGIDNIEEGIKLTIQLTEETRTDIAASRADFTQKFQSLQQDLVASNLASRDGILEEMRQLRSQNAESMAAFQANLASINAEKEQLQRQVAEDQVAKARMDSELQAKTQEIERRTQEYAQALEAARQAAASTAQQLQAAKDQATAAEVMRLQDAHSASLNDLTTRLSAAVARTQVAEQGNQERILLIQELARVRAQIAAIPPVVIPPPEVVVAPKILRREPEGEVKTGTSVKIIWDPNGTAGPWILRIDYGGTNSDFQEVTMPGPIDYIIKRPGALSGRIYNIKQV